MSRTRYILIVVTHSLLLAAVMVAIVAGVFAVTMTANDYGDPLAVSSYPRGFLLLVGALGALAGVGVGVEQADTVARFGGRR